MQCVQSLTNHFIFVARDIRAAGIEEVEYLGDICLGLITPEIARHQTPDVLGQRAAQIAGPLPGPPLLLWVEHDLGACHHDVAIITSPRRAGRRILDAGRIGRSVF